MDLGAPVRAGLRTLLDRVLEVLIFHGQRGAGDRRVSLAPVGTAYRTGRRVGAYAGLVS